MMQLLFMCYKLSIRELDLLLRETYRGRFL